MDAEFAPSTALVDDIALFRRFNRAYTRFIGTLHDGFLNTEFTLAEGRILYEIENRESPTAKEVAAELGMDPGYLSRLLGKMERDELLTRKTSEKDGRYAELLLTPKGRSAIELLNSLADKQARDVLGPLTPQKRSTFVRCIRAIDDILLQPVPSRPLVVLRPHRVGDMGWVVCREGAYYAEEFGWDDTFEALVARIVADFITNFDPKRERCWIAEVDGESVGHIFLVKDPHEVETARLRLLFVEPSSRGMGVGNALVTECIQYARRAGYRRITLWTQSILTAAHRIYEKAGFRLIAESPHHSFGKDLLAQTWNLEL